jgi:ornithine cyclodeaminase/alanine dehydrogenase-like protein (mu-crystallin family)
VASGSPPTVPPLRYLSATDVAAAMPALQERLALADRTMRALVADAELPPKIGVHPRPEGSFGHAMPAFLRGGEPDGSADGLGMKWVTGFGTNNSLGLPAINALVVLNDPSTGLPLAILDGGTITANRTAAVSGVAIQAFAPPAGDGPLRAALIGAGTQGGSHLPVLGHVLPGVQLSIFDRHPERAELLAARARDTPGIASAAASPSARSAIREAAVVVTAASFGPVRQVMTTDWLRPNALVVAVDYATYCSADVARTADLFLVDEREQFRANRAAGAFDDYPDPAATIGEALLAATPRPPGRVVVSHLGVGLADVIFGRAILTVAERLGLGTLLER